MIEPSRRRRVALGRALGIVAAAAVSIALSLAFSAALAANPTPTNRGADDPFELRLKRLETELRCLVCQNQTLADSNAELASDLRREVRELAVAGKSDDEIRSYLTARYGDFVLYDPPLKATTWLLWIGPFTLLAGGGFLWWLVLHRRARAQTETPGKPDAGAAERARALLDSEDPA